MANVGIFIYGAVVFALVATSMAILAWGIVTERRARLQLEASQRARRQGSVA